MSKKLYERETINKVYKAIEIHIKILSESNVYLGNSMERERLEKSIDYLEEAMTLLKPLEDEINKSKREAFSKFQIEKKKLEKLKRCGASKELINKQEKITNDYLRLYLAFKGELTNVK